LSGIFARNRDRRRALLAEVGMHEPLSLHTITDPSFRPKRSEVEKPAV